MSGGKTSHAERIGEPGAIVRHAQGGGMEMVNLIWGLEPAEPDGRPFEVVRTEGREFPRNRCLVPASEFFHVRRGRRYRFARADGDWFYLGGIWRPATIRWPAAYAVLTVEANPDVRAYAERQMVVIPRHRRLDWLNATCPETDLLCALPADTFSVELCQNESQPQQSELAF